MAEDPTTSPKPNRGGINWIFGTPPPVPIRAAFWLAIASEVFFPSVHLVLFARDMDLREADWDAIVGACLFFGLKLTPMILVAGLLILSLRKDWRSALSTNPFAIGLAMLVLLYQCSVLVALACGVFERR